MVNAEPNPPHWFDATPRGAPDNQSRHAPWMLRAPSQEVRVPQPAGLYEKEGGAQTDTPSVESRVRKLYQRHADEFRKDMTALIRMQTGGGMQEVRVFSLRGCHLLGMFARTTVAKQFRSWALDVLDSQLNEGKGWQQEFNKAWMEYTSEKAVASLCGKRLRRLRDKSKPLMKRVTSAADKAQILLPL